MEVGQKVKIRHMHQFTNVRYGVISNIEEHMFDVKLEDGSTMTFENNKMYGIRQYTGWMVEGIYRN